MPGYDWYTKSVHRTLDTGALNAVNGTGHRFGPVEPSSREWVTPELLAAQRAGRESQHKPITIDQEALTAIDENHHYEVKGWELGQVAERWDQEVEGRRVQGAGTARGGPTSEARAEQGIKGQAERMPSKTGRQSDEAAQPQHVERRRKAERGACTERARNGDRDPNPRGIGTGVQTERATSA
ncbi:uncharacterized protein LAESUDRAFT_760993 [Laetiporus sulphureus 93-53]|uniref:Uncharacterized protein n=1 Tax=Laetiporus sulphureus 93-53 TaxID=1314785 RepID=A0A165DEH4_9APHY|nr:uncharacterized protein LAESUDRAFT_760993 [Laetiporus sulphureus 93-53]KZT04707.1 hypothetical protein LAESUDRAFT_760993 [Laetiporus sulphureus 93-53]